VDSRPVREEVVDKVSVGPPMEPVVFRGRSRSREAFPVATPGVAHISKPSGDVELRKSDLGVNQIQKLIGTG
jgi:hypothetical protein